MTTSELRKFIAQEMEALREKKTTIEIASEQAKLAGRIIQTHDIDLQLAKAISKAPNITTIISKIRTEKLEKHEL